MLKITTFANVICIIFAFKLEKRTGNFSLKRPKKSKSALNKNLSKNVFDLDFKVMTSLLFIFSGSCQ